jgi:hypothetical protein
MLMAWISALPCLNVVPPDLIVDLAIPQGAFEGDDLALLESLGELRETDYWFIQ